MPNLLANFHVIGLACEDSLINFPDQLRVALRKTYLKNNMIGVFQLHGAEDPKTGGSYTVKRLKLSTQRDPDEGSLRVATLIPENPAFKPIPVEGESMKFVAEFLEVLRPLADGAGDDYKHQFPRAEIEYEPDGFDSQPRWCQQ